MRQSLQIEVEHLTRFGKPSRAITMDAESEAIIHRNMRSIAKGRTVLIIAHRLSAIRMADRIITMENGAVTEMGTHDSLLAAGGRYAQLWRTQMYGGAEA